MLPRDLLRNARFGNEIVIHGDTAIVTGRAATQKMSAYIYNRPGDRWVLSDDNTHWPLSVGAAVSIDFDGTTLAMGHPGAAGSVGAARIYERTGGPSRSVLLQQVLSPAPQLADSHFGRSVAVDGDVCVVGAPLYWGTLYRGGAVFVYERIAGSWTQVVRLEAPTPHYAGFFGYGLALEGDLLVVGEPGNSAQTSFSDGDRVHFYRRLASGWSIEESLHVPSHLTFGSELDIDQGRVAIGASRGNPGNQFLDGAVHIYEYLTNTWQRTALLGEPYRDSSYGFGVSLDLLGDRLAVGSVREALALRSSDVHLFELVAGTWMPSARVEAPDLPPVPFTTLETGFGAALALTATEMWVGAPSQDWVPAPNSGPFPWFEERVGAVYRYDLGLQSMSYCPAAQASSSGLFPALRSTGCATLYQNDLRLEAFDLPQQTIGFFLLGLQPGNTPNVGGQQGTLCLSGGIGRFNSQVGTTGMTGRISLAIELEQLPGPLGLFAASPGQTLYFQAWFRDINPLPTSNMTHGLQVTVQ